MSVQPDSNLKSYRFFECLFEHTKQNHVLLMDSHGIIISINKSFTDAFGYQDKDIVGKYTNILFTAEDKGKGLPEIELKNVLATGQSTDNNYLVHLNGSITWVSGESIRVTDPGGNILILKIIQNIHQQKTFENSLKQLYDFNERILESIEDIVIVVDEKMDVIKANKAFSGAFGHNTSGQPHNFCDLIKPYDINDLMINRLRDAIQLGSSFTQNVEIRTATGEKRMMMVSFRNMEGAEEKQSLVVLHDMTAQVQADKHREDIIGFVAHELRNPLANIVLCNELLNEALQDGKIKDAKEFLSRGKNNVMRLNKMIRELYDATKVNSGHLQLERALFNFQEMIDEAIETINVLHPAYKINVSGKASIEVMGDRFRLIQVVTNYISNGIKYSLGSKDVKLEVKVTDHAVIVAVKDEGLGIGKDQLPFVFDRFFRAEKTRNFEGIGLGLYLCKQIVDAHNGKVWAESEEGKGSTFYFSIPR